MGQPVAVVPRKVGNVAVNVVGRSVNLALGRGMPLSLYLASRTPTSNRTIARSWASVVMVRSGTTHSNRIPSMSAARRLSWASVFSPKAYPGGGSSTQTLASPSGVGRPLGEREPVDHPMANELLWQPQRFGRRHRFCPNACDRA